MMVPAPTARSTWQSKVGVAFVLYEAFGETETNRRNGI